MSSLERRLNLAPSTHNGIDAASSELFNVHQPSEFTVAPTAASASTRAPSAPLPASAASSYLYVPQHPVAIVTPPTQQSSKIGFVPAAPFAQPQQVSCHSPALYLPSPLVGQACNMLQNGIGLPQGAAFAAMMSPPNFDSTQREPIIFSPPPFAFAPLASGVLSPPADIYPSMQPPMPFGLVPGLPQLASPQMASRRFATRSPKNSGPMVKREGDWRCDRCRYLVRPAQGREVDARRTGSDGSTVAPAIRLQLATRTLPTRCARSPRRPRCSRARATAWTRSSASSSRPT